MQLQFSSKLEHFLDDVGGVGKAVDRFFHRHFDPILLYLSFKIIVDEYSEAVGVCENVTSAIHYRTYKDLVPVYDNLCRLPSTALTQRKDLQCLQGNHKSN